MIYRNITASLKLYRAAWLVVNTTIFRIPVGFWWQSFLLRLFGAQLGRGARVYPSVNVWCPLTLMMGSRSCLAPQVQCYNVAPVFVGDMSVVSQNTVICTASHVSHTDRRLTVAPVWVETNSWIGGWCFICPGCYVASDVQIFANSHCRGVIEENFVGRIT